MLLFQSNYIRDGLFITRCISNTWKNIYVKIFENLTKLIHFQNIYALEQAMLSQDISIPVYFSKFNAELDTIIEDISNIKANASASEQLTSKRDSALGEMINSISANGYQVSCHTSSCHFCQASNFQIACFQVVVSGAAHTPNKQSRIPIIQGELIPVLKTFNNKHLGGGTAQQQIIPTDSALYAKLPLIIVTANINTFGLIHVSFLMVINSRV